MADLAKIADNRTNLFWFTPDRIQIKPGLNGRDLTTPDNFAHVRSIADSIAANGYMQSKPLEIFQEAGEIFLSDGHCRLAAIHLCIAQGIAVGKVPCVQEPRGTNDVSRILNQDAHNSGKRLTPLELGGNIKRAMALDGTLTVAEVAKRMGKSVTYVNQALDFQAAPAEVHALVKSGEVSATFAAKTIRQEGAAKGTAKLKAAVETAKAKGKGKASAKDTGDARPPRKQLYADLGEPSPKLTYAAAIDWIAEYDDTQWLDDEDDENMCVTASMLAHLTGKSDEKICADLRAALKRIRTAQSSGARAA